MSAGTGDGMRPGMGDGIPAEATGAGTAGGTATDAAPKDAVLETDGLTAGYNGSAVLRGVSLTVRPGEVVALVGANGAGTTTTLRTIVGVVKPMRGRVLFAGDDLGNKSPDARARQGIAHVPEGRGVFFSLTVAEHWSSSTWPSPWPWPTGGTCWCTGRSPPPARARTCRQHRTRAEQLPRRLRPAHNARLWCPWRLRRPRRCRCPWRPRRPRRPRCRRCRRSGGGRP